MLDYIHDYRRRLDDLRRIAGADNEGMLSPAFAGLLEDYGRECGASRVGEPVKVCSVWTIRTVVL